MQLGSAYKDLRNTVGHVASSAWLFAAAGVAGVVVAVSVAAVIIVIYSQYWKRELSEGH